jgi:hypothetical protein
MLAHSRLQTKKKYRFTDNNKSDTIQDEFPLTTELSYRNVYKFIRDSKYDTERTC